MLVDVNENCTYINRNYNVEYFLGNGKIQTFNANMVNIEDGYFYFEDEDNGLIMIRQDVIRTMTCKPKNRYAALFKG